MKWKNDRNPKKEDGKNETSKEQKDYYFLREVVKEKPLDKKKMAVRGCWIAAGAVLFGVVAAFVFARTEPLFREEESSPKVSIPDEEPTEPTAEPTEEPQEAVTEEEDSALEDIQQMYSQVLEVAREPEKAIVSIQGYTSDEAWLASQGTTDNSISGLLAADNGKEYFVLTEYRVVADVDRILVTFVDGSTVDANFQKQDPSTGLAVLKIAKEDVDNDTKDAIAVAELGTSYNIQRGTPVLALGSPAGYEDSIAYGMITSVTNTKAAVDTEYHLLTTDIMGDKLGSGVLVDLNGEIVGIIAQSFSIEDDKNVVTALPISELRDLIENLSNNEDLVYLGVMGQDIGSELSEKTGIPKGVYVNTVSEDSPAMEAGIQNGDVIVRIGESETTTLTQLRSALDNCQPGRRVEIAAMRKGAEGYVEIVFDVTPGAL